MVHRSDLQQQRRQVEQQLSPQQVQPDVQQQRKQVEQLPPQQQQQQPGKLVFLKFCMIVCCSFLLTIFIT